MSAVRVVLALAVTAVVLTGCSRRDRLGDLPYFPGAVLVGATSSTGEQFGFPPASWQQVELRTASPYDQVRDFYAKVEVRGLTSTFESELPKSAGRVYTRFMADGQRRRFYAVTVEERTASRDVSVLLRYGTARQPDARNSGLPGPSRDGILQASDHLSRWLTGKEVRPTMSRETPAHQWRMLI